MSSGGYDPKAVEHEIYASWEAGGYFHAEPDPARKPFVITIPPPNVTGALHLGHALNNTLQDILIRRKRMQGFNACWLPGTDHAGIATQAVVEKRLREEQKLSRHEIGRTGLVKKIWEWKEEYNSRILNQLRRMGCSCDWGRTRFTLDEQCAKAVYETFFRFFKDGLIYRGLRLVNWDTQLQTAVADDEVYHETVRGSLWHIRYPISGSPASGNTASGSTAFQAVTAPPAGDADSRSHRLEGGATRANSVDGALPANAKLGVDYLVVATTRPETMLADSAVAVHPDDQRYKHLHGGQNAQPTHFVQLPLMNRRIPIVADGMLVSREFGTGCVKVTPGHDPNDFACYQRKLGRPDEIGIIDLLTPDGKINENGKGGTGVPPVSENGKGGTGVPPVSENGKGGTGVPPVSGGQVGTWESGKGAPDASSPSVPTFPRSHLPTFDYSGMKKEDARKKVVADLEALGLLEKVEPYETEVGHSDRSKTPIEPLRSEQWFVAMDQAGAPRLAEMAMEAVADGRVKFFPERYAKSYLDWLGQKRDWCISRQLWWGHRIPVWSFEGSIAEPQVASLLRQIQLLKSDGRIATANFGENAGLFVVPAPADRENVIAFLEANGFRQDPDVLDTWFSSALWPHSTFGWPGGDPAPDWGGTGVSPVSDLQLPPTDGRDARTTHATQTSRGHSAHPDLDYFYPTSVLSTAREIITLWVARMVMTGLYNVGRVPFQHVYIHAVIQDGQGRRMSKSAGNGVDPLDIIDVYGADALRFTLAQLATETQDIRIPVKPFQLPDGRTVNTSERFELGRNFCNKVYQAATGFVLPNIAGLTPRPLVPSDLAIEDRWILSRLGATIDAVDRAIDAYAFAESVQTLYAFFWTDFCDWYVEFAKPRLTGRDAAGESIRRDDASAGAARQVLAWVLDQSLRLLHPAIPYVTETVWKELNAAAPRRGIATLHVCDQPLIVSAWPSAAESPRDLDIEREIGPMQEVIRALREIRTSLNAIRSQAKQPALRTLPAAVVRCDASTAALLERGAAAIRRLGQVSEAKFSADAAKPAQALSKILAGVEIYVPIAGLADLDIERTRLTKERDELAGHLARLEGKLANEGFVAKARPEVVEAERARLEELRTRQATIARNLAELSA